MARKRIEEALQNGWGWDNVMALVEAAEVEAQQMQVCVCVQQWYRQPAAVAESSGLLSGSCHHHEVAATAVSMGQSTSPESVWLSSSIA